MAANARKNGILIGVAVVLLAAAAYLVFFRGGSPVQPRDADTVAALEALQADSAKDPTVDTSNAPAAPRGSARAPKKPGE